MKKYLLIFLFFVYSNLSAQVKLDDKINDFTLKSVDNKMYSLNMYKNNKAVVVIFDCNVCPYSKAYNKRIINLREKYVSKGIEVLLINPNDAKKSPGDSFEKMIEYAKEKNYKMPYLYDENQEIAKYFGATNTPHVFVLVLKDGSFYLKYKGTIDNNYEDETKVTKKYLENAIEDILKNEEIKEKTTKAIGCTIKWKS